MSLARLSEGDSERTFWKWPVNQLLKCGSLILGCILGVILVTLVKVKKKDNVQIIALAFIGLATGLSLFNHLY